MGFLPRLLVSFRCCQPHGRFFGAGYPFILPPFDFNIRVKCRIFKSFNKLERFCINPLPTLQNKFTRRMSKFQCKCLQSRFFWRDGRLSSKFEARHPSKCIKGSDKQRSGQQTPTKKKLSFELCGRNIGELETLETMDAAVLYCLSCNITVFAPYPPKPSTLCPAEKPPFSEKPMVALMMIRMSCSFYSWRPPCFCHSSKAFFTVRTFFILHIVLLGWCYGAGWCCGSRSERFSS